MKKIQKGDYGYINQHKIIQLCITFVSLLMVLLIFYTGILQYHNTKNIFTVIAAVSVIPAAKFAVSYLVLIKHHSCDRELYENTRSAAGDSIVLADLVISSTEKTYPVPVAVIRDNSLFLYSTIDTSNLSKTEKYIRQIIETESKVTTVRIFTEEEKFINATKSLSKNAPGKFDEKIKHVLLIYSM